MWCLLDLGGGWPAVYKSTNSGYDWENVYSGTLPCMSLAINPVDTNVAFTTEMDIMKTVNGGQTWQPANVSFLPTSRHALVICPSNPLKMFAAWAMQGYKSTNGGALWTVHAGLTGARDLCYAPTHNNILYGIWADAADTAKGLVKVSHDSGATWTTITADTSAYCIKVSPKDSNIVYLGTRGNGLFKSNNGGKTWVASDSGLTAKNITAIALCAGDSTTMYVASADSGVFKSTDSGNTWSTMNAGLTSNSVWSLAVDPHNATKIYAGANTGVFIWR
jgi:photosystem II stability/assembly factor-like uncharacterized protein